MKINSRHYVLVIMAIGSITLAVLSYVFVYKKTSQQARNYGDITAQVIREDERKHEEQGLVALHSKTVEERKKISAAFVSKDSAVEFIELMEKIGDDSKTKLDLSSIASTDETIKAHIDISGTWGAVMAALTLLENIPLNSFLSSVRLDTSGGLEASGDKKASGAHTWKLSLDIEALILPVTAP